MTRHTMKRIGKTLPLLAAILLIAASDAPAQRGGGGSKDPHIGYVYPAGAQRGEVTRIQIGGQFLDGVDGAVFFGGGVRATVIDHDKPLAGKELNKVRMTLQEVREKIREQNTGQQGRRRGRDFAMARRMAIEAGITPEQIQKFQEYTKTRNDPKIQANPQLAEIATLEIEIDPDARLGRREIRLVADGRLSNPLVFYVSDLPEALEEERNDEDSGTEIQKSHPFVLNGQIVPGDVDRFSFKAKKGEQLVVAAAARDLMPHLADAVPGWFQATMALYDAKGNEVAYADDYRFNPDPVLYYRIPKNGTYTLEIKDAIYRGREDFVYRISVGELPFVTSVFPLGGRLGSTTTLQVRGVNLPARTLSIKGDESGRQEITALEGNRLANRVPFAVDEDNTVLEAEPNDDTAQAQPIKSNTVVNGRIQKPGDRDVYAFEGIAGRRMVAEIRARRLNSPLDSVLKITDAEGKVIAVNDDHEDKSSGLITHHADSFVSFTLPTSKTHYIHVGDIQNQGSEAHAYRLHLHPSRPDFALRVVPSAVNALPGATVPISVFALREDGFDGAIELSLQGAPDGFELSGARIPSGQDSIRLTLTLPQRRLDGPKRLVMTGRARIAGKQVTRRAVPAEDMMQAFIYRHLVPAENWLVSNVGKGWPRPSLQLADRKPIKVSSKGTAVVKFSFPGRSRRQLQKNPFEFELSDAPEGLAVEEGSFSGNHLEIRLRDRDGKLTPGTQGNLIVATYVTREIRRPGSEAKQKRRFPVGFLPAIPYRIVP